MVMVVIMNIYCMAKEVVQISQQVLCYYTFVILPHIKHVHKSARHQVRPGTPAIRGDE